jgi:hypothetical protein
LVAALVLLGALAGGQQSVATDWVAAGAAAAGVVQAPVHQPAALPGATVRVPAAQIRALAFLCHRGPGASARFNPGAGSDVFGPVKEQRLSAAERAVFDRQWAEAVAAAVGLTTPEQAGAAGYVQAAPFNVGVGTHWIKWSLIARPFDPAAPSMLLFDGIPGRTIRLVGFSYWVESDQAPVGFAGPNDRWHRHAGLCFSKDGWLHDQNVSSRAACEGYWLNGKNLWMLHAWVVPDTASRWGRFAPTNPYLCPAVSNDLSPCRSS